MIAFSIFLLTWLGGSVATGSVSAGFHAAASIYLYWSIICTVLMLLAVASEYALNIASLVFWGCFGLAAAYCLTLGGGWFITLGIVLWFISVIAEIRAIPDLDRCILNG